MASPTSTPPGDEPIISAAYRAMQAKLHAENPNYGVASIAFAPLVAEIIRATPVQRILDYGAGKGRLAEALPGDVKERVVVTPYDPAIEAWSATPQPAEMVTCIDVLEHIEPDRLGAVLDDLKRVTLRLGLFSVHTGPAMKTLADGRNAHLIQQPASWWLSQITARFRIVTYKDMEQGFWVIVEPSSVSGGGPVS